MQDKSKSKSKSKSETRQSENKSENKSETTIKKPETMPPVMPEAVAVDMNEESSATASVSDLVNRFGGANAQKKIGEANDERRREASQALEESHDRVEKGAAVVVEDVALRVEERDEECVEADRVEDRVHDKFENSSTVYRDDWATISAEAAKRAQLRNERLGVLVEYGVDEQEGQPSSTGGLIPLPDRIVLDVFTRAASSLAARASSQLESAEAVVHKEVSRQLSSPRGSKPSNQMVRSHCIQLHIATCKA